MMNNMCSNTSLQLTSTLIFGLIVNTWATQDPVNLGTADHFAILTKAGITTTGTTNIVGDMGVSPIAASAITGFSLARDASGNFATSPQVTGRVYASDYTPPTPAQLTVAVGDMGIAYNDAAGRVAAVISTELGAGNIGGMTLAPGLYKWGSSLLISTDITLAGPACGVWIFQIAGDLTVQNGVQVIVAEGAMPKNIFWQVAGEVLLGTTSHFEGVVLGMTAIHLQTGASINGVLLSHTAVTLNANTIVKPDFEPAPLAAWLGAFDGSQLDPITGSGWIRHPEHGGIYSINLSAGSWLYDPVQHAWLWANECSYPYLYNSSVSNWIYYLAGGNPEERWFFHMDNASPLGGAWQSVITGYRLTTTAAE
jgi:hypothetical protein